MDNAGTQIKISPASALIYMDDSGSRASGSRFFVYSAVKLRQNGRFTRAVRQIRDRTGFDREFKFSKITRGTLPAYYAVVDALEESDARIGACVVNRDLHDPFQGGRPVWLVHSEVAAQLLVGVINRGEQVGVLMDGISTPPDKSLEDTVKGKVNRKLKALVVVSAACLDSTSNDVLQVADLVAGAVAHDRRRAAGESGNPNSNKAKVAARLKAAFGVDDFADGKVPRINIATYRGQRPRQPQLTIVERSHKKAG